MTARCYACGAEVEEVPGPPGNRAAGTPGPRYEHHLPGGAAVPADTRIDDLCPGGGYAAGRAPSCNAIKTINVSRRRAGLDPLPLPTPRRYQRTASCDPPRAWEPGGALEEAERLVLEARMDLCAAHETGTHSPECAELAEAQIAVVRVRGRLEAAALAA